MALSPSSRPRSPPRGDVLLEPLTLARGVQTEGGNLQEGKPREVTGRESTFTKTASGRAIQTWTCPPWAAWPQGHCPVTLQLEDTEAWMPASLWDCPGDGRLAACPDLLGCSPPPTQAHRAPASGLPAATVPSQTGARGSWDWTLTPGWRAQHRACGV